MAAYAAAWNARDASRASRLFTPDVRYSFDPFAEPLDLDELVRHWSTAFATQTEVELSTRLVTASGDDAVIEWWASILTDDGAGVTLSATLLLHLAEDGRVDELHEHWLRRDGRIAAPARFS